MRRTKKSIDREIHIGLYRYAILSVATLLDFDDRVIAG